MKFRVIFIWAGLTLLNELPHLKRLIVFFIKYIRLINKKEKQRQGCFFNFDYEKIYFHVVGGVNHELWIL